MAYSLRGRNVMAVKSVQGALSLIAIHTCCENTHIDTHMQDSKSVMHKLCNIDHWTKGGKKREFNAPCTLYEPFGFRGFFLICPAGDFSLMCYIAMSLNWGKWYLQTIHGLWFNLFGVWGSPQMAEPESSTCFLLLPLENQFLFTVLWLSIWSDITWNVPMQEPFPHTYLDRCSIC